MSTLSTTISLSSVFFLVLVNVLLVGGTFPAAAEGAIAPPNGTTTSKNDRHGTIDTQKYAYETTMEQTAYNETLANTNQTVAHQIVDYHTNMHQLGDHQTLMANQTVQHQIYDSQSIGHQRFDHQTIMDNDNQQQTTVDVQTMESQTTVNQTTYQETLGTPKTETAIDNQQQSVIVQQNNQKQQTTKTVQHQNDDQQQQHKLLGNQTFTTIGQQQQEQQTTKTVHEAAVDQQQQHKLLGNQTLGYNQTFTAIGQQQEQQQQVPAALLPQRLAAPVKSDAGVAFPVLFSSPAVNSNAFSTPVVTSNNNNNQNQLLGQSNGNNDNVGFPQGGGASCYDSRLTNIINYAVTYYAGNMGSASIYILDQIRSAGFSGYWLVHAQMLSGRTQGIDWQSLATGDIFKPKSRYGCYYNDSKTFILVVSY